MSKKYKVPITTYARVRVSKFAGYVECDSFEEYTTIMARDYDKFLDSDTEVLSLDPEDIEYYKNN